MAPTVMPEADADTEPAVIGFPAFHEGVAGLGLAAAPLAAPGPSSDAGRPAAGERTRLLLLEEALPGALPWAALAHATPALLFACSPDGRTLYVNRHWFEYTGLHDTPSLAERWHELLHPEDQLRLLRQWQHPPAAGADEVVESQFRLRHASGEFRWHLSRARLLRGADGQPQLWAGSATEIERQKRVEDALDRREREFRTLVDNAPDGITRLDRQLRHVYANQAIRQAFGIAPNELIGHTAAEAGLPAVVAEGWRDGALRVLIDREEQECEFSTPSASGDERHYVCRLIPETDAAGRVESVLCIAYDVTHRRRALMALKDSEQRFRQFAQSSDDVFWFADLARGELLYVSPAFERLWGTDASSLQADPDGWRQTVQPEDRHALPTPFYASAAGPDGHEPVREYRLLRRDGSTLWIRDRRFHLQTADGRVLRIGGIAEDITERKLRDLEREGLLARERAARSEAEALASAKDEFLAVVSHELRSPLNAIRGWAHVLRKTANLPESQLRPLDAIDRNVAAQARMVDDLLDTQRLLRGKVALEKRRSPLAPLLEQAVDTFRPQATEKQLQLQLQHAADVPMVDVDPERLRQALVNLLSNAVKFTPTGGRIDVRSRRTAPDRVSIDVADTGVGLEPTQAARVFEPFRQASGTSSTRRQGGLGLGLALARQLVELHGGRLGVRSDGPDRGATFTMELPAPPLEESAAGADAQATVPAPAFSLRGRRVAVVEDDPEGRQILELLLRDEAVEAAFFSNADEGFAYLCSVSEQQRPEVLISDIAMPGEDGYSFIRRVRELHRERGEPALPAVAVTAFASPSDRVRVLAAGFDAHLGKPMDPDLLRGTLKELLRETPAAMPASPAP
ncbi:hybrid sensor histidine kinase/response regulator [Ideonella sp. BN130291]|uniref:hybrid sensor histidine kinase/response regulator n=1 Tax=Ideonella sp. BN130291 TaxID=3112940 RepID=UPI002E26BD3F|nr:PAS domain S-box protein [Ideonella sp. BN130291]